MSELADSGRVDAIVPVRDGAPYLAEAIESMLGQTRPPDRVIVVDDGSSDDSAAIAERFGGPVELLRQPPSGGSEALNRGLEASDAPLVTFLDADDLWEPRKLELQLAALAADPALEAVYGHVVEFADNGLSDSVARSGAIAGLTKSTLLIRRTAIERVGHFDTGYAVADFPEWYSRCRAAHVSELMLDDVVARRRVHGANVTVRRRDANHAEYLRIARAAIAQRRTATFER